MQRIERNKHRKWNRSKQQARKALVFLLMFLMAFTVNTQALAQPDVPDDLLNSLEPAVTGTNDQEEPPLDAIQEPGPDIETEPESVGTEEPVPGPLPTIENTKTEATGDSIILNNNVSGILWLDENNDGIMNSEENGVAGYTIYLFASDDTSVPVRTTETLTDGTYNFENMEPGSYVVGVASEVLDGIEYLLPLTASNDNRFTMNNEGTASYSVPILVEVDSTVSSINAGMRQPLGIMPLTDVTVSDFEVLKMLVENVVFKPGETIFISGDIDFSGPLTVNPNTNSLTIKAAGADTVKLISNSTRHFIIPPGSDVQITFENVILDGNKTGGGIEAKGSLTLIDADIRNCFATEGGGIAAFGNTLILERCNISDNQASNNDTSQYGYGGGIYSHNCNVIINNSKITGNKAARNGGGVYANSGTLAFQGTSEISANTAADGGGVNVTSLGMLTVNSSSVVFADNKASRAYDMIDVNDIALHSQKIQTNHFTAPFQYVYNNYDVVYTQGTRVYIVTFVLEGVEDDINLPPMMVEPNASCTVTAPQISNHYPLNYTVEGDPSQYLLTEKYKVKESITVTIHYTAADSNISVSIPTQLVWAAFELDGGEVVSPVYTITNHSQRPIDVSIASVSVNNTDGIHFVQSISADGDLRLDVSGVADTPFEDMNITGLDTSGTPLGMAGILGRLGGVVTPELPPSGKFTLSGWYQGGFSEPKKPVLNAIIRLELDES